MIRSAALVICLSIASIAVADSPKPPVAPVRPVTALYQGISVNDPYRYLEQLGDPEVLKWVGAQSDHTRRTLDRIQPLAKLRARVEELDASMSVHIDGAQRTVAGPFFYLERKANEQLPKLYVRPSLAGAERLLFDPDEAVARGGKREAITRFAATADGKVIALVTGPADTDVGSIRVRDVTSGKDLGARIDGVSSAVAPVFSPDGKAFFYTRAAPPGTAVDPNDMFTKQRLFRHRLDGGADVQVFGWQAPAAPPARALDWPSMFMSKSSPYVVGQLSEGANGVARLFVCEREKLGTASPGWIQFTDEKDGVRDFTVVGHWLYIKTFVGAPRFHVLRYDLAQPKSAPIEVVPQQKGVIDQIAAASDALYFVVRDNATSALYRLRHGTAQPEKVELPWVGAVTVSDANPDVPGILFTLDAWTRTGQLMSVTASGGATNTGLIPVGPFGTGEGLVSEETTCKGWDGTRVPMSLVAKKGFAHDGKNPTLLYGYGGYGSTETASFDPTWRALLELGGVFVVVNPRGSGAYGEEWYQAGRGAKKSNTWKDMIACAETLIASKVTSSSKLAIWGWSMGGVAVGRAVTERPDLFGVALMQAGAFDALRFIEATPLGPDHETEMGSLASGDGVRVLLEMSAYHHVKDGVKYPAVMVVQGMKDHRIAPWSSFKMAARLQAATASGKPVLLRVDAEAGHGLNTTSQQRDAQWADLISFFLWNAGRAEFAPR
jgi:prolyl oligopeptidase